MEGFTLIPKKQKEKINLSTNSLNDHTNNNELSYNPNKIMDSMDNIRLAVDDPQINNKANPHTEEIIEETVVKRGSILDGGLILFISVLLFLGSLAYCGYLFFMRQIYVAQVDDYAIKIKALENKIDKREIEELQNIDKILKSMKGKIENHILASQIFLFINKNMRSSLQVTEYKVEPDNEGGVAVVFSCLAPGMKDLAEQTEKMVELQKNRAIRKFSVTNLTLEQEGGKVRFSLKVTFDKKQVTAGNINTNN